MKIFDCTTYFDEALMMDVRFNILNEYVEKFIVVESKFSHSGKQKKLNFDINNYKKFKDKIIYLIIENEPEGLLELNNNSEDIGNNTSIIMAPTDTDFPAKVEDGLFHSFLSRQDVEKVFCMFSDLTIERSTLTISNEKYVNNDWLIFATR